MRPLLAVLLVAGMALAAVAPATAAPPRWRPYQLTRVAPTPRPQAQRTSSPVVAEGYECLPVPAGPRMVADGAEVPYAWCVRAASRGIAEKCLVDLVALNPGLDPRCTLVGNPAVTP